MNKFIFVLNKDKVIKGPSGYSTWVEAGPYKVVRVFDADRVMVDLRKPSSFIARNSKAREITLLKLDDGELMEGDIDDVR